MTYVFIVIREQEMEDFPNSTEIVKVFSTQKLASNYIKKVEDKPIPEDQRFTHIEGEQVFDYEDDETYSYYTYKKRILK